MTDNGARFYRRLKSQIQVDFSLEDEVSVLYSYNICARGMYLETVCPFAPGTKLSLRFNLPDSSRTIHAVGEVVHVIEESEDVESWRLPGMGIEFVAIDEVDVDAIQEFVGEGHPDELESDFPQGG